MAELLTNVTPKKDILAGTFIKSGMVPRMIVKEIVENFGTNKIFIFDVDDAGEKKFLITFNVTDGEGDRFTSFKERHRNTITLHRKKDTNTLYTINSLNEMIAQQNNTDNLDWSGYKNSCVLLSKDKQLKVLKTRLYDLIEY